MKRRDFVRTTAVSAVAVSAFGFMRFDGERYVGDCETTSDILGPFYRPNSPVRTNLRVKGLPGQLTELRGQVRHIDCATPYNNAKVELWHCDVDGVYDNHSPEFRYRGTTFTDKNGNYSFQTIFPVAYGGQGFIRPAHFHLIITAAGYQPLVTQLYFSGDEHIKDDIFASSPNAKRRILDVEKDKSGVVSVRYDVGMSKVLHLEAGSIDKLVGKYVERSDKSKVVEIFNFENRLWKKNEAFGQKFEYIGNNIFEEASTPADLYWRLEFKIAASGSVELTERFIDTDQSKKEFVYLREKAE
jgi:catechol 1,2-dioxygenase